MSFVNICEKIDHVLTAPHCMYAICLAKFVLVIRLDSVDLEVCLPISFRIASLAL